MGYLWIIAAIALIAIVGVAAASLKRLQATRAAVNRERAIQEFAAERDDLTGLFLRTAAASGKPRGLRWTGCEHIRAAQAGIRRWDFILGIITPGFPPPRRGELQSSRGLKRSSSDRENRSAGSGLGRGFDLRMARSIAASSAAWPEERLRRTVTISPLGNWVTSNTASGLHLTSGGNTMLPRIFHRMRQR